MRRPTVLLLALLPFSAPHAGATCWAQAAARYGISALELAAHACVESEMRPDAIHVNAGTTGAASEDLGLMQINSAHLTRLARYGITREILLRDACTNLMVGAQILAESKSRYGDSWNATGAYNAGCATLHGAACVAARARYAWRVYHAMNRLRAGQGC